MQNGGGIAKVFKKQDSKTISKIISIKKCILIVILLYHTYILNNWYESCY